MTVVAIDDIGNVELISSGDYTGDLKQNFNRKVTTILSPSSCCSLCNSQTYTAWADLYKNASNKHIAVSRLVSETVCMGCRNIILKSFGYELFSS